MGSGSKGAGGGPLENRQVSGILKILRALRAARRPLLEGASARITCAARRTAAGPGLRPAAAFSMLRARWNAYKWLSLAVVRASPSAPTFEFPRCCRQIKRNGRREHHYHTCSYPRSHPPTTLFRRRQFFSERGSGFTGSPPPPTRQKNFGSPCRYVWNVFEHRAPHALRPKR